MDILMIYWNSVWANSRRRSASLLADHSSAEMQAYERRLRAADRHPSGAAPLRMEGGTWKAGRPKPGRRAI